MRFTIFARARNEYDKNQEGMLRVLETGALQDQNERTLYQQCMHTLVSLGQAVCPKADAPVKMGLFLHDERGLLACYHDWTVDPRGTIDSSATEVYENITLFVGHVIQDARGDNTHAVQKPISYDESTDDLLAALESLLGRGSSN